MRNLRDFLDLEHKKSLRFGLLLLSTLLIVSASALVYARLVYKQALSVGNTSGVTTGSGTTAPTGASFPLGMIAVLAFSALIISISLFAFLREASKHLRKTSAGQGHLRRVRDPLLQEKTTGRRLVLGRKAKIK